MMPASELNQRTPIAMKHTDDESMMLSKFSRIVRQRRDELKISQEELSNRSGLHRTYISDVERGSRNLSVRNLIRLARALETSASGLMRRVEESVQAGN